MNNTNVDLKKSNGCKAPSDRSVRRIAFIDPAVADFPTSIADATSGTKTIVLDECQDGIAQIGEILENYTHLEAIHLVSHGQPGSLQLGNSTLNQFSLKNAIPQFKQWAKALAPEAEIWIYGCRVAAGKLGSRFIQSLSEITGMRIAASTTLVGNGALGGNWELDATVGEIRSQQAFHQAALDRYPGVLNVNLSNVLYAVEANSTDIRVLDLIDGSSEIFGTLEFATSALAREAGSGLVYYVEFIEFGVGNQIDARVATWNPDTDENNVLGTLGGPDEVDPALAALGGAIVKLAQASPNTRKTEYRNQLFALGSSPELFLIDRETGKATSLGNITTVPDSAPPENPNFVGGGGDAAFDPDNPDILYVTEAARKTNASGQSIGGTDTIRIFRVNLNNLEATYVGDTGLPREGAGSLAFGEDGELYLTSGGNLYQVSTNNASPTFVADLGRELADFASLPLPSPQLDLQVTKTDNLETVNVGEEVTYTITIKAAKYIPSLRNQIVPVQIEGIVIEELLPEGIDFGDGELSHTISDGTGTLHPSTFVDNKLTTTADLSVGATLTLKISGIVREDATGTLTNIVTVSPPPGIVLVGNPPDNQVDVPDTTKINDPVDPPVEEPVDPPVEEPVDPPVEPPVEEPVNPGSGGSGVLPPAPPVSPEEPHGNCPTPPTPLGLVVEPPMPLEGVQVAPLDSTPMASLPQTENQIDGSATPENLVGTEGNDDIRGEGGDDILQGEEGDDVLVGGPFSATPRGSEEDRDLLAGNAGNDFLAGSAGEDTLHGGKGDDISFAGKDNDRLWGDRGN
ncbi:MAG: DUF4347 domain-containing protein, partial [Geitlerinemataceae cyanobacterium]